MAAALSEIAGATASGIYACRRPSTVGGCAWAALTLPPRAPSTHAASAHLVLPVRARCGKGEAFDPLYLCTREDRHSSNTTPPPTSPSVYSRHVKRVHGSDSVETAAMEIRLFFPHA